MSNSSWLWSLTSVWRELRAQDFVDLALVWFVLYRSLLLTKKSGAVQILAGLGVLALASIVSHWFEFLAFGWILEKFFGNLFLIAVILFQAEIRRALAQIGSSPLLWGDDPRDGTHTAEEIVRAVLRLATQGHGALIVIEREINLDYFIELGPRVDAVVSQELLISLFHPQGPMHDGAVLIRDGRIASAGNFLPLTKNPTVDRDWGTRHRAAMGLTEETDALVIVVSEERHSVAVAASGTLKVNLEPAQLREILFEVYGLKFTKGRELKS